MKRAQGRGPVLTMAGSTKSPVVCVLLADCSFRIRRPPTGGPSGPATRIEMSGRRQYQRRGKALR